MRHEQIAAADSYDRVEIHAVWPATHPAEPAPADRQDEPSLPTAAAPDVPAAAGRLLFAAYAGLIGAFALVTAGSAESLFAIAICAVFLAMFFAVPLVFFATEPEQARRVSFDRFLREGMETLTGHCGGLAALVQMLIVPVLLTLGVLTIGLAKALLL